MLSFLFLLACGGNSRPENAAPKEVTQADLDRATTNEDYDLFLDAMRGVDETIRTSATERLLKFDGPKVAETVCKAIKNNDGTFNVQVVEALKGEKRTPVAKCLSDLVMDPTLIERDAAITFFADLEAPIVNTTLDKIAKQSDSPVTIRVQAAGLVAGDPEYIDTAFLLLKEKDPALRAGALDVLGVHTQNKEARKPITKSLTDNEPLVRAAALKAFYAHYRDKADEKLCTAMMDDPEPLVRIAAIEAYEKLDRRDPIRCLSRKAKTIESEATVRQALLKTLGSAKDDAFKPAYNALCSSLTFWLKNYIKGDVIDNLKGVDIVKTLNNAHPTKSKKCINAANARASQFSCYAKMHIALWYNLKNGTERKSPLCPGMDDEEGYTENID